MKNVIRLATTDSTRRQSQQPNVTAKKPVIVLSNLRFGWKSDQMPVLDIENLSIQKGGRVFIAGPSGCGKSTLLSLLAGVIVPQHGRISVLGQRLDALNGYQRDRFRADHIGFIFQMFNLIPYLSVVENVTLPCRFSTKRRKNVHASGSGPEEEALRLLQQLGLAGEQILNRPVTELSVGQQQRVAAARALIGRPKIIIADEPTSSLDHHQREAFIRLLLDECDRVDTTLLFVSHDTSLAPLFDRKIELKAINRAGTLWPASDIRPRNKESRGKVPWQS